VLQCLLATQLLAQPQIGGGICSSSTLSGVYSITLSGRDYLGSVLFGSPLQGIGTARFDGVSKVTFSLTNNTNETVGVAQVLSGIYSLQSNCVGVLNINSGDTANFGLVSYNRGQNYLITGGDGVYAFTGGGSSLPATCVAVMLAPVYSFRGTGFVLNSGAVTDVTFLSGVIQFSGASSGINATWNVVSNGSSGTVTAAGTFTVRQDCTATANVTDTAGNAYSLVLTITSANGANFIFSAASSKMIFAGSGRTL
jgi:hypothetical protein